MAIELKKRVSKLLKKYHTVYDVLWDYEERILDLPHTEITNRKFALYSAEKHALKLTDVKNIKKDPKLEVLVIRPQEYNYVSILNNKDTAITDDNFYSRTDKLARTGSGAEMWIKVTNDFADWLEKLIPKIEKATENAKKAAEKAKQATSKNVKAVKAKRVNVEQLQEELQALDFSGIAGGDTIIVWVQEIESDAGIAELPMFKIEVPTAKKRARSSRGPAAPSKDKVVSLILEKLTQPLIKDMAEDVFVFYQLLAALALSGDGDDEDVRAELVQQFENGDDIGALPLLRIGKYPPVVYSFKPWKENGKVQVGVHQLFWTN